MPTFMTIDEAAREIHIAAVTLRKIVADYCIGLRISGRWRFTHEDVAMIRKAISRRTKRDEGLGLRPRAARAKRLKRSRVPWPVRKRGTATRPKRKPLAWKCGVCEATVTGERCPDCQRTLLTPAEVARRLTTRVYGVLQMAKAGVFGQKVKIFRSERHRTWWRFTAEEVEAIKKDFYSLHVRSNPMEMIRLYRTRVTASGESEKNLA